jgi:hypothetical protein
MTDTDVLMVRLGMLKAEIAARDWARTEFEFDRVLSAAMKLAGTRGRAYDPPAPPPGWVRSGHAKCPDPPEGCGAFTSQRGGKGEAIIWHAPGCPLEATGKLASIPGRGTYSVPIDLDISPAAPGPPWQWPAEAVTAGGQALEEYMPEPDINQAEREVPARKVLDAAADASPWVLNPAADFPAIPYVPRPADPAEEE